MAFPRWDDSYSIGLPTFDSEHRLLLGKVEAIGRALQDGVDQAAVVGEINDLLDLYLRHIAWEERWLDRLQTPAGHEHRNRHLAGHRELAARAELLRENLLADGNCHQALEDLGFFFTLFELIQYDFEMVGLLRKEGLLTAANAVLLADMLPDPLQVGASARGGGYSPKMPKEPEVSGLQVRESA